MRIGRAVAGICVTALAVAAGLAGSAGAGVGPVPPESLGASNGLRYMVGNYEPYTLGDIVVTTACPAPAIVGGGVDATGPRKASRVSGSRTSEGDSWYGEGQHFTSTPEMFSVFAICRTAGAAGVIYEFESQPIEEGEVASISAECPGGTRPLAGGPDLTDGNVTRSMHYDDSDRNKTPDGWRIRGRRGGGGGPDSIGVGVVCFEADLGQVEYVKESTRVKAGKARSVKATCPRSKSVTGGGFKIGGGPDSFVHSTKPLDGRVDNNDVPDDRWESTLVNGGNSRTRATSTAICLG
jgi:hypothetical protein